MGAESKSAGALTGDGHARALPRSQQTVMIQLIPPLLATNGIWFEHMPGGTDIGSPE